MSFNLECATLAQSLSPSKYTFPKFLSSLLKATSSGGELKNVVFSLAGDFTE